MRKLLLLRIETGNEGTFGIFSDPEGAFFGVMAEPPERSNEPFYSCIPPGEYLVEMDDSPRYGRVYHVRNVPGRTDILQHVGNWSGDKRLGFKTNSDGCQLFGERLGSLRVNGRWQRAVLRSGATMERFFEYMNGEPYMLTIREAF